MWERRGEGARRKQKLKDRAHIHKLLRVQKKVVHMYGVQIVFTWRRVKAYSRYNFRNTIGYRCLLPYVLRRGGVTGRRAESVPPQCGIGTGTTRLTTKDSWHYMTG